jgi:hypothetical protein
MPVVVLTTGRASHGRQVKGDDPYYKGYPGPPGWGFGVGLTNTLKKNHYHETSKEIKLDSILDEDKENMKVNKL